MIAVLLRHAEAAISLHQRQHANDKYSDSSLLTLSAEWVQRAATLDSNKSNLRIQTLFATLSLSSAVKAWKLKRGDRTSMVKALTTAQLVETKLDEHNAGSDHTFWFDVMAHKQDQAVVAGLRQQLKTIIRMVMKEL